MSYKSKLSAFITFLAFAQAVSCQEDILVDNQVQFERLFSYDAPTGSRYAQGMDILNGDVFQGFSDGTIDVISMSKNCVVQTLGPIYDEKGKILHMNDISFRMMEDKPILIVPGNGINSNNWSLMCPLTMKISIIWI